MAGNLWESPGNSVEAKKIDQPILVNISSGLTRKNPVHVSTGA